MSVELKHYNHDGANWQTQAILAIIKGYELEVVYDYGHNQLWENNACIAVGRYENNREQGYVFTLLYKYKQLKHYAVYEHRNTDELHIITNTGACINTPTMEFMWHDRIDDKYATDAHFEYGAVEKAARWIIDDMIQVLKDEVKDKE